MYTPKPLELNDIAAAQQIMTDYSFALVVTTSDAGVEMVHIPTALDRTQGDYGCLHFHVAKQNPIWKLFDGAHQATAVFTGPHAYISPDWYDADGLVPTWNYMAVHATGAPTVVGDADKESHLDQLAAQEEAHLVPKEPWTTARMNPDMLGRMMGGIVGLSMPISQLQAKAKLSQNRTDADRTGILEGLRNRGGDLNTAVANAMVSPNP